MPGFERLAYGAILIKRNLEHSFPGCNVLAGLVSVTASQLFGAREREVMDNIMTARLTLRPLVLEDFEAHYAMVGSDPRVTWQREVHSREQALAVLHSRIRDWQEHGFGMWAVIERATGQLIGHGGLQNLEQTGAVELGYYLGRPAWGKGYATEIGRAALEYGFTRLRLPEIVAVVRHDNHASQRVLTKLGFHHSHDAHHYGFDVQYWRSLAADHRHQSGTR